MVSADRSCAPSWLDLAAAMDWPAHLVDYIHDRAAREHSEVVLHRDCLVYWTRDGSRMVELRSLTLLLEQRREVNRFLDSIPGHRRLGWCDPGLAKPSAGECFPGRCASARRPARRVCCGL